MANHDATERVAGSLFVEAAEAPSLRPESLVVATLVCTIILAAIFIGTFIPLGGGVVAQTITVATKDPMDALPGLWVSKKRFGPDAKGLLVIYKVRQVYC